MDALATIAVEIRATFTAVLVIALIVILQILDLRRAKREHTIKLQELSDSSQSSGFRPPASSKKYRLISVSSLILQFLFGIIVFAVFSCWALYLVKAGYMGSAAVSGITALVSLVTPFVVWFTSRHKNNEMAQLITDFERRPKITAKSENKPAVETPAVQGVETAVAEIKETSVPPVAAQKPVPADTPAAPEAIPVTKAQPIGSVFNVAEKTPEDSMLRRHYLAHKESLKQADVPIRPTDSMLRRHYDSLMASLLQPALKPAPTPSTQAEPSMGTPVALARECLHRVKVPQDSMLRRHFLSVLRSRIEDGLPPSPTDSMLKRHFDGWKNELIDRELNSCVSGMEY